MVILFIVVLHLAESSKKLPKKLEFLDRHRHVEPGSALGIAIGVALITVAFGVAMLAYNFSQSAEVGSLVRMGSGRKISSNEIKFIVVGGMSIICFYILGIGIGFIFGKRTTAHVHKSNSMRNPIKVIDMNESSIDRNRQREADAIQFLKNGPQDQAKAEVFKWLIEHTGQTATVTFKNGSTTYESIVWTIPPPDIDDYYKISKPEYPRLVWKFPGNPSYAQLGVSDYSYETPPLTVNHTDSELNIEYHCGQEGIEDGHEYKWEWSEITNIVLLPHNPPVSPQITA